MRLIFFLLHLSFFLISCAQNDTNQKEPDLKEKQINSDTAALKDAPANPDITEKVVVGIRNEFKRINSLRLQSKKYKFVCDTDGEITYYTDNGHVVKIVIDWGFIGDGSTTSEYYYKDDKLIFTYEVHTGGPANGTVTTTEYRTYVNNNKTLQHMENQKVISCTTCQFNQTSREYKAFKAYNTNKIELALCN